MGTDFESRVGLTPADWPGPGPIDLTIHDLPHDSSAMEWWYVNCHVTAADGRPFSLFAAFFRVDTTDEGDGDKRYSHFLTWALVDPGGRRYFPFSLLDPQTPRTALQELASGRGPRDERLARALREILRQGRVPLPDRLLQGEARVALDRLALDFDGNRFEKDAAGRYALHLEDQSGMVGCDLRFTLEKPVVRHGDDGVVRGLGGDEMFYYFSPRCLVEGTILVDGARFETERGSGWYDREFGGHGDGGEGYESTVGWNWVSAQLDNGYEISAYNLFDLREAGRSRGRWVIVIDPSGARRAYTDFSFEPLDRWTSTRTFNEYPTRYRLEVERARLSLDIAAVLPGQEIVTVISPPGFWEGLVTVQGLMHDAPVSGTGFVGGAV